MKQFGVMYRKELLEQWRLSKWIWVPIVIIILGLMQPISYYFMPQILEAGGNMPEGAIIQIPKPSGIEVMVSVLEQYGTIGLLVTVLVGMAAVSGERRSGVLSLIMVKPVSSINYIVSKWMAYFTLMIVSYLLSYLISWYYTNLLFSKVSFSDVGLSFLLYSGWIAFLIIITMLFTVLLNSNGAIAGTTIILAACLSIATGFFEKYMKWSPAYLVSMAESTLTEGNIPDTIVYSCLLSLLVNIIIIAITIMIFNRQEKFH